MHTIARMHSTLAFRFTASFWLAVLAVVLPLPLSIRGADDYKLGTESSPQDGVPCGEVTKYSWTQSAIYPGTVRDYWVYVPQQYDASKPACVMVFQDGRSYLNSNGQFRVTMVFDNLIHKKEMPVTIGVF